MTNRCEECYYFDFCDIGQDNRSDIDIIAEAYHIYPEVFNNGQDYKEQLEIAEYCLHCIGCACSDGYDQCLRNLGDECNGFESKDELDS